MVKMLPKLSLKGMGCEPRAAATSETPVELATIFGVATKIKMGEDGKGDVWTALIGQFEGVNLQTGEVFQSGKLFLPSGIQELIEEAIGNNEGVEFAFKILSVKASNPIGYSYQAETLTPPKEKDNLSHLRSLVAPHTPAIEHKPEAKK